MGSNYLVRVVMANKTLEFHCRNFAYTVGWLIITEGSLVGAGDPPVESIGIPAHLVVVAHAEPLGKAHR